MAHRADTHDGIADLHMGLRIPRERGDSITRADIETLQDSRNSQASVLKLCVTNSVGRAIGASCHHFGRAVPFSGVLEKLVQRQRKRLHVPVNHWHPGTSTGSDGGRELG